MCVAAESHRILVEVYVDRAFEEQTCTKWLAFWCERFCTIGYFPDKLISFSSIKQGLADQIGSILGSRLKVKISKMEKCHTLFYVSVQSITGMHYHADVFG